MNRRIEELLSKAGYGKNREDRVRQNFWSTARRAARQIPLLEDVIAGYYCAFDNSTPFKVRGIMLAALGYFVLPTDTIPDFIAGFGFTDDFAVLTAALTTIRSHITPTHRRLAKQALDDDIVEG